MPKLGSAMISAELKALELERKYGSTTALLFMFVLFWFLALVATWELLKHIITSSTFLLMVVAGVIAYLIFNSYLQ